MVEAVSMEHEIDFQLRLLHMPSALFFFFFSLLSFFIGISRRLPSHAEYILAIIRNTSPPVYCYTSRTLVPATMHMQDLSASHPLPTTAYPGTRNPI